jgi:nitroreductase
MSQAPAERATPGPVTATVRDVIVRRRSVRSYRRDTIPDAVLHELIDLARRAPSSMDGQPCHFLVVRDRGTRARLAAIKARHCPDEKRGYPCDFVADAPVVIAVCVDRERSHERGLENAALAAAFLLLAAADRGLGAIYLTAQRAGDPGLAADVKALFALPPHLDPIALIPLGHPAETPTPKTLRPLAEIVHDETFHGAPGTGDRRTQ